MTTIEQRLDRIEKLLEGLVHQQKPRWVKASAIVTITGWDGNKMRWAREAGVIKFRKVVGRVKEYDLNSLPTIYIEP